MKPHNPNMSTFEGSTNIVICSINLYSVKTLWLQKHLFLRLILCLLYLLPLLNSLSSISSKLLFSFMSERRSLFRERRSIHFEVRNFQGNHYPLDSSLHLSLFLMIFLSFEEVFSFEQYRLTCIPCEDTSNANIHGKKFDGWQ